MRIESNELPQVLKLQIQNFELITKKFRKCTTSDKFVLEGINVAVELIMENVNKLDFSYYPLINYKPQRKLSININPPDKKISSTVYSILKSQFPNFQKTIDNIPIEEIQYDLLEEEKIIEEIPL